MILGWYSFFCANLLAFDLITHTAKKKKRNPRMAEGADELKPKMDPSF
jgi:hypothetical protein